MVGMWMASASLVGTWLWTAGGLRRLRGVPSALLVPALVLTSVLCKSAGALVLLAVGLITLFACRRLKSPIPLLVLAMYHIVVGYFAIAPLYESLGGQDLMASSALELQTEFLADVVTALFDERSSA